MSASDIKTLKNFAATAKANAPKEVTSFTAKAVMMLFSASALLIGLFAIINMA